MFLDSKWAIVQEGDHSNPSRGLTLATTCPPAGFKLIAAWEDSGICFTEKVGDENDECARNCDQRGFELQGRRSQSAARA